MAHSANIPDIAKLRWRCRRGTKELDTLTIKYLDNYFSHADLDEQCAFAALLELQDPMLYKILSKEEATKDPHIQSIVNKIHLR